MTVVVDWLVLPFVCLSLCLGSCALFVWYLLRVSLLCLCTLRVCWP